MPIIKDSSKELMLTASALGQEALKLFAEARSIKDSNKKLEITNRAVAKMAQAARLRKYALLVQLAEIREVNKKPLRSYVTACLVNSTE